MKKHIIAFYGALFLAPVAALAQGTPKLGINAGATYSSIRGNEVAEANDGAVNFLVGASLEIPLTDNLSFLTNVNYERKSFSNTVYFNYDPIVADPSDPAFRSGGFDVRYTLNFVSIPLNLKYYLGSKKNFYINGGPYAAFFAGENFKVEGRKTSGDSDTFKTLDFGVNLGVGTRITLNEKSALNIELRDNLGLINISKLPVVDGGSVKTNSLNLIVNWEFML